MLLPAALKWACLLALQQQQQQQQQQLRVAEVCVHIIIAS
jgi:hypothetical protein